MKQIIPCLFAVLLASGCAKRDEPTAEMKADSPSRVRLNTHGDITIRLDAATQKIMGLQVAALTGTRLQPEVKGYGRVLDPASLSSLVAEVVSARAADEASRKELERMKSLSQQDNASARALQAAEVIAQRDAVQAGSACARLLAATGNTIAGRSDLPAFLQSLASGRSALVRIDLPAGEDLKTEPESARLVALAANSQPVEAKLVGPALAVDPQTQGRGFLFLVESNHSRLAPGTAIMGLLNLAGDARIGVTVPGSAVVRFNGATWIYLQPDDETFQRIEVVLETPVEGGWFVHKGLKPQDKAVTVGAQQLLSEERKGQIGGE